VPAVERLDRAALEVEELELTLESDRRIADAGSGLVPEEAWRPRTPAEVRSGTNFSRLAATTTTTGQELGAVLADARRRYVGLLVVDLRGRATRVAVSGRLLDLAETGPRALEGAEGLLAGVRATVLDRLVEVYKAAGATVVEEAGRVGVNLADSGFGPQPRAELAGLDDADDAEQLTQLARRLAADVAGATVIARDVAVAAPNAGDVPSLLQAVAAAAGRLADGPLEGQARNAAAAAGGLGRVAAVRQTARTPAAIYASELLDRNVCGPCSLVDGATYADLDAARVDYPAGQFRACAGGERCRGTLVFVWEDETPATLPEPGDRPRTPPPSPARAPGEQLELPRSEPVTVPRADKVTRDPAAKAAARELAIARRTLKTLREQLRRRATAVQLDALGTLEDADALYIKAPKRIKLERDPVTGAMVRHGQPEFDWFYSLPEAEQSRLRRRWLVEDEYASPVDEVASRWMETYGTRGFDDSLAQWLDMTRRYDSGGWVGRGRTPGADGYGDLDVDGIFGDGTYRVFDVLNPDEVGALEAIAATDRAQAEEWAARVFGRPRTRRPAPYAMTEAEYLAEVADLNEKAYDVRPLRVDEEFGAEYTPEHQAIIDRLEELIPPGVDDEGLLDARALYAAIRRLAEQAGLI